jgi:Uma2 family endonuclease
MKVSTDADRLYAYPDLSVVCGAPRFRDDHGDVLRNPRVVFEVLSPSTEGYDRGRKFERYQQTTSLTDYVLVAQDRPRVEHFARQPEGRWLLTIATDLQTNLMLASIGCDLPLAEIYDRVEFPVEKESDPEPV